MSEISRERRYSRPHGDQRRRHPVRAGTQTGLLPQWIGDYRFPLVIGAVLIMAALDAAARAMTWGGLLSVLAAVGATAIWIWRVMAGRRLAVEEALRQLELYELSCLDRVDAMEGSEFERYVAELLRLDGHQDVLVVGGKGDGGVDITSADPSGRPMAYQCKRQKDRVPVNVVRELKGSLAYEHGGRHGVVVTTAGMTKGALSLASDTGITVIERTALAQWMGLTRNLIDQQGNTPHSESPPARRSPSRATAALGWAAVLLGTTHRRAERALAEEHRDRRPSATNWPGHGLRRRSFLSQPGGGMGDRDCQDRAPGGDGEEDQAAAAPTCFGDGPVWLARAEEDSDGRPGWAIR
jgi:restriction system protein